MGSSGKNGRRGADEIEDAEIVSEKGISTPEPSPGDGAEWIDGGTVAIDVARAEPEAAASAPAEPPAESDPEPEVNEAPSAPTPPAPPAPPQKSGGGFIPAVLGGLVAAGIGFGAALYLDPDLGGDQPDPVKQALDAQDQRLSDMDARLAEIAQAVATPQTGPIEEGLSGLADRLSGGLQDLGSSLSGIEERLSAVESRPLMESSETAQQAFAQYEQQLQDLQASLDEQQSKNAELAAQLEKAATDAEERMSAVESKASDIEANAEARANRAAVAGTVAQIETALERGTGFADALSALPESVTVPEALTANAETGVATMAELRGEFPAAARAALDTSIKDTVSDDVGGRFVAFLRTQTGARSLAPREGEDPDAVLSRAEAALVNGDLPTTVAEIGNLPEAGQAAMADWVARAQTRIDVVEATSQLSASVQDE